MIKNAASHQTARLKAILKYRLLQSQPHTQLDQLVALAGSITQFPYAIISIAAQEKQLIISSTSFPGIGEQSIEWGFLNIIMQSGVFTAAADTLHDEDLQNNMVVAEAPYIRAFAGYPIHDRNGDLLGALYVMSEEPAALTKKQIYELSIVVQQVIAYLPELRKKEEVHYYTKLFDISLGLICIADERGKFLQINSAFTTVLGWDITELAELTVMDIVHPDDVEITARELANQNSGISTIYFQHRLRTKSGDFRYIEWVATPEAHTGNIFAIGRDITREKNKELALIASETNARVFFEHSLGMMCRHDLDGNLIYVNKASADSVGYTVGELQHMSLQDLVPEQYHHELVEYLRGIRTLGQLGGLMHTKHKNGSIRIWLFNNVLIKELSGANYVIGNAVDITQRYELENDLKRTKEILERTNKVARIGGWEYDVEKEHIYWSSVTREIHEAAPDFIPTMDTAMKFFADEDSKTAIDNAIKNTIETGKPYSLELKIRTAKGKNIWVCAMGYGEFHNGKCIRLVGTLQDINESYLQREELKNAKLLAEQASKAKSEFLANMSHEIRTPLNGIIGFTDLVQKTSLNETQKQYTTIINQSANVLLSIINDILDFSKIEAGKLELDISKTDIFSFASEASDILSYQAQQKGLEMLLNISPDLPRFIWVDSVRLKQILVNLLGNAVKFTETGEIELAIYPVVREDAGKSTLRFEVRDTGIGIHPEKKNKIFEAFLQEDISTTKKYGGTGLGLTISNKLLHLMGSEMKVYSELGAGSMFYFEITVHTEEGEAISWENIDQIKNVLVVDDNENNRIILRNMLLIKKIKSDVAANGMEALQLLLSGNRYDVILMDYHMPLMDGIETIRKIRAHFGNTFEDTSIILLHSSSDDETIIKACKELDVTKRLLKPVKIQEFYYALSHIVAIPAGKANEPEVTTRTTSRRLKFLVAEDNPINKILISTIIRKFAGQATILEANNGQEAVDLYKKELPDIVLMDIQMPVLNGYEATRMIRSLYPDKHVPIIALTAGNLKGERERCLEAGMDDFVPKPFVEQDVLLVLEKWLPAEQPSDKEKHFSMQLLKDNLDMKDESLIREVLEVTIEELRSNADRLRDSWNSEDIKTISEIAHKLRGAAFSVGMTALHELSTQLNGAKNMQHHELNNLVEQTITEIKQVTVLIQEEIDP